MIAGGGIHGNLPRVLGPGQTYELDFDIPQDGEVIFGKPATWIAMSLNPPSTRAGE